MAKSIRLALWNANGLQYKNLEIENFLNVNNVDILLVSETHFTDRTYIKIPHYTAYHTEHPDGTAHGGSAILIRSSIKHYEQPEYKTDYLQATTIQVAQKLTTPINVSAIYCPPRHTHTKQLLQPFFETLGQAFIAGGDFNAKHTHWGSRLTTTKGRVLFKLITDNKYEVLSTRRPTYWPTDPNKIPDLLDFFITNGLSPNYMEVIPNYDLMSDHSAVIATISTSVIYRIPSPSLANRKTDWNNFKDYIEQHLNRSIRLKTTEEIEVATNHFTTIVQEAGWNSTPQPTNIKISSPNIPNEIMEIVKEKRRARARWQRTHSIEDKRRFNQLNNQLRQKLKTAKNETFKTYLQSINTHDNSIWNATKGIKQPKTHIPPIRNGNTWLRTDKEKAEAFADHLAEVFQPNSNEIDQDIEEELQSPLQMSLPIRKITANEIEKEIKKMKNKKAPGQDLITTNILKQLPGHGIRFLQVLFNGILRLTHWPLQLKFAQIILIQKPGKPPTEVNSYRPISLLPTISKLLERLILRRINENSMQEAWLPNHQFGFRQQHSTIQQCHRLTNIIQTAQQRKSFCTTAFLDVRQAFDRVWHRGLQYKIKKFFPSDYYLLLRSYLTHRTFQTRIGQDTSQIKEISAGVPQGSVLGPMLYLLFTSDLPTTESTEIGTLADDTAVLACNNDPIAASAALQHHLNQIEQWLRKWRIRVNETKSAHVTFTTKHQQCPAVILNNTILPQTTEVKYLGLHIDKRLTWKTHINKKRKQMDLKLKQMYWIMGKKSNLSLENKILLYKSIIRPIWTYGCQLWGCASRSNVEVIQRFQSKTIRTIADAPWYVTNQTLHVDFNIPYVKDIIKKYAIKHQKILEMHPNESLPPLTEDPQIRRLQKKWPKDLTV